MQAGKPGSLFEGMLRGRDHQKEQIAGAHPLKPLTDGNATFDPRVQDASAHGASPWCESSDRGGGDDSTGKRSRCPDPGVKAVIWGIPERASLCSKNVVGPSGSTTRDQCVAWTRCKMRCLNRHRFGSWVEPTTHCFFIRSKLQQRSRAPFKYSRCYEGNTTDVVALGPSLAGMVGQFLPQQAAARLTLVLDKGNVSRDNFQALTQAQFSFIAAIPAGWVRRLYQVSLKEYQALALAEGSRIKVYCGPQRNLGGTEGKLLVSFSPNFYRNNVRTLDLLQRKAEQKLLRLQASVREAAQRHRPRTERAVRGEIAKLVRHDRLKDFLVPTFQ